MKWRDNSRENGSGPDKLSLWAGEKRPFTNTGSWLCAPGQKTHTWVNTVLYLYSKYVEDGDWVPHSNAWQNNCLWHYRPSTWDDWGWTMERYKPRMWLYIMLVSLATSWLECTHWTLDRGLQWNKTTADHQHIPLLHAVPLLATVLACV